MAVEALKQELSSHKAKAYISFMGDESDCNAAVLQYEQVLKVWPMQMPLSMHWSMILSGFCTELLQAVVAESFLTLCHTAILSK